MDRTELKARFVEMADTITGMRKQLEAIVYDREAWELMQSAPGAPYQSQMLAACLRDAAGIAVTVATKIDASSAPARALEKKP
jgi:hypothetical protein